MHSALHSTLAQGHGNITIVGGDRTTVFIPRNIRVADRNVPQEPRFWASSQAAQFLSNTVALFTVLKDLPGFGPTGPWDFVPLAHQGSDARAVFPPQPVRQFPEHDGVDALERAR